MSLPTSRAPGNLQPPKSWAALQELVDATGYSVPDRVNGPTNSHANLRLFGGKEEDVRVTLFRDHFAWCPYCQKIWQWLEEKRIPYRVGKVTMFCYGQKEQWYRKIVPSGMLPALELDGSIITESDDILMALEREFGPLNGQAMDSADVLANRRLERFLFRAWCSWLCYPSRSASDEAQRKARFVKVAKAVEASLSSTPGPYFLESFGTADIIFTPYVERMNASLFYYKGYELRREHPKLGEWFDAMEGREVYRGTQSDFHTHAHDLPPQMGGCYHAQENSDARAAQLLVDEGPFCELSAEVNPSVYAEPLSAVAEAAHRVIKFHKILEQTNPAGPAAFDAGLRATLTALLTGEPCPPQEPGADVACRYVRDRISVPRDMSIWAAKRLRQALEDTAALQGHQTGPPIPLKHRRDVTPAPFLSTKNTR